MNALKDLTPQTVTASFKWTCDEFVEAQQSHVARQVRPWLRRAFCGVVLLVFALTLLLTFTSHLTFASLGRALFVLGACFLVIRSDVVNGWSLKSRWKRGKLRERDVIYRFTSDALIIEDTLASATMRWEAFVTIVEARRGFLLYPQAYIFHWVPFHAFEDAQDMERVREFIVQSEVPFKALKPA